MNRKNSIFLVNKYDLFETTFSDDRIGPTYDPELTRYVKKLGFD